MPIYEYECLTCGATFEKRQKFSDAPEADCPNGHDTTRRLLAAPAIVFKGSGFYINDSKSNSGSGKNGASKSSSSDKSSGDSAASDSGTSGKDSAASSSDSSTPAAEKSKSSSSDAASQ